jgi:hypothetical protein
MARAIERALADGLLLEIDDGEIEHWITVLRNSGRRGSGAAAPADSDP